MQGIALPPFLVRLLRSLHNLFFPSDVGHLQNKTAVVLAECSLGLHVSTETDDTLTFIVISPLLDLLSVLSATRLISETLSAASRLFDCSRRSEPDWRLGLRTLSGTSSSSCSSLSPCAVTSLLFKPAWLWGSFSPVLLPSSSCSDSSWMGSRWGLCSPSYIHIQMQIWTHLNLDNFSFQLWKPEQKQWIKLTCGW